ncbi:MAG: flippase-like domain-containing protein [Gammaproteobacteria bacterium]|nr:flippase-like domain-containing protein [Gammaproteobacteria bacterium]
MNRKIFKILQIFITLALLTLVLHQAGLFAAEGRRAFVELLSGANFGYLFLSVLVGVLINMSSALKWFMLTRARGIAAGYWRIFCYYLIGQFYNQILPTSVGGDVVRSYQLGKFSGRQADALASVFVERYTGVLVLLLVAAVAVLSQSTVFDVPFVNASLTAFAIGLAGIAWLLFDQRLYRWVKQLVSAKLPLTGGVFAKLDKLLASVDVYKKNPTALMWAFINSLVFYFIAVLNVYVTALVFQIDVQFVHVLIATPIIMLIMNIPLSVGNIGLMEFAYVNVFQLLGYSPALALSVALLMRLKSLFDGAMGGLLHPFFITNNENHLSE